MIRRNCTSYNLPNATRLCRRWGWLQKIVHHFEELALHTDIIYNFRYDLLWVGATWNLKFVFWLCRTDDAIPVVANASLRLSNDCIVGDYENNELSNANDNKWNLICSVTSHIPVFFSFFCCVLPFNFFFPRAHSGCHSIPFSVVYFLLFLFSVLHFVHVILMTLHKCTKTITLASQQVFSIIATLFRLW